MKKTKILLVGILLVASFLRLWKLSEVPVSMFGDELDVGYQAYSIIQTGKDYYGNFMPLQFHSLAEYRTPLYLYSAVPTVALFGISPWGVRLPAAIMGILGVWGIFLLVTELLSYQVTKKGEQRQIADSSRGLSAVRNDRSEAIALVAAFVLAISPWHIQYSRAGFEVTELLAFLLFGLYFFLRSFKEPKFLWVSALLLVSTP
jgi:4-amino-4-deoxy-L-arabinose transferase-like glycosyltransferase